MFTTSYKEWQHVQLRVIRAYRDAVPKGSCKMWTTPGNSNAVWCILEGCVDLFDERGERLLHANAGEWVFKPPIRKLYQCFSDGAKIISIWFKLLHMPTGRPMCTLVAPFSVPCADEPELETLADSILVLGKSEAASPTRLKIFRWELTMQQYHILQARLHGFVAKCVELMQQKGATLVTADKTDRRVLDAARMLNSRGFTGSVPYDNLLPEIGISRVQLDRLFLQELGVTPKQYMDRQILAKAVEMLADERASIKSISFDLGFKSPAHFCSWFRRQTGVTPGKYQAH